MPGFIKVGFIGHSECGKTQLISRFIQSDADFKERYIPTFGCDFSNKIIDDIAFMLWEFPGNERAETYNAYFWTNITIAIYCVDLSRPELINKDAIRSELEAFKRVNPDAIILLAGTKCDAHPDKDQGLAIINNLDVGNIAQRFVTSAKEKIGFDTLTACLKQDKEPESSLSAEQIAAISKLIISLEREIKSCWPYPNKDRKRIKMDALSSLITKANTLSLAEALVEIEEEYPGVRDGNISTRTNDLLNRLNTESPSLAF